MNIEVVLTQDDPKLGKRGQVVKVSEGFANNFLFPHHKAVLATPSSLKSFKMEEARRLDKESKIKELAENTAKKIESISLTIEVNVGEGDKLYGAVTSHDIQQALSAQVISVEKKDVHLEEPIKKLGNYQVPIKLHPTISAQLKLWVVKKK